jgi:hypothetical protein
LISDVAERQFKIRPAKNSRATQLQHSTTAVLCLTPCCLLQMEETTPPYELDQDEFQDTVFDVGAPDEIDEDEFGAPFDSGGPPVESMDVPDDNMAGGDVVGSITEDVFDDSEVPTQTCYCQAPPSTLPLHYSPCCLPLGVRLATREIQMFPEFRKNLLLEDNSAPKTQTCRVWGDHRARAHKQSFSEGRWIRVWRGQGHKDTIGWLLITHWDAITVGDIDKGDCVREGRPDWEPKRFKDTYLRGMGDTAPVIRIKFIFRPCHACVPR